MTRNDFSICQSVKTMLTIFRFFLFLTVLKHTHGAPKKLEYPWVIGATRCSINDYPFVVSIRKFPSLEHICGGTLILPSWVLTSTTCLAGFSVNQICVTAGSECLSSVLNRTDLRNSAGVSKIVFHPNVDVHNIAVMKLKKRLKQSLTVSYVKLANYLTSLDDFFFGKCVNSTILSWGYDLNSTNKADDGQISNKEPQCLHCITFSLATRCTKKEVDPETNTEFCSNPDENKYCQKDSGGPLMCNQVQIGIVKVGCLDGETGSIYTRVDIHMDFIYKATSTGSHFYFRFPYFVIISLLIQ